MSTKETGAKEESPGEATRMETPETDPGVKVSAWPEQGAIAGLIDKAGDGGQPVVTGASHIGVRGVPLETLEGRGIRGEVVDEIAKRGPE